MGVQRKIMNSCYIICGGPESCSKVKIPDNAYVICADSGYDKALSAGIKPDLLIGDFDSVKSRLPDDIDVVKSPSHKDDTDTLLAVRTALEKGFDEIILAGACGGRTDHTLANIATLLFIREQGAKAYAVGDESNVYILSNESLRLKSDITRYLSVFAVSDEAVVSISGCAYPLDRYLMKRSFPIGVSNEFIEGKEAVITCESGLVAVLAVKK